MNYISGEVVQRLGAKKPQKTAFVKVSKYVTENKLKAHTHVIQPGSCV